MAVAELLKQHRTELADTDGRIRDFYARLDPSIIILNPDQFVIEEDNNLQLLSLPQLDSRYTAIRQEIDNIATLKHVLEQLLELHLLVEKDDANPLDFHRLFQLIGTIDASCKNHPDLLIYQQILKDVDATNSKFIGQLGAHLHRLIPNAKEADALALGDFNSLLVKHLVRLDWYDHLKREWDIMAETLVASAWQLQEKDGDHGEMVVLVEVSGTLFLELTFNFVTFINNIGLETIRRYLNLKVSRVVVEGVLKNINHILPDAGQVEWVKKLATIPGWLIFPQFDNNRSVAENLKVFYDNFQTDEDIQKVRDIFEVEPELEEWLMTVTIPVQVPVEAVPVAAVPVPVNAAAVATVATAPPTLSTTPPKSNELVGDWDEWGDDWSDDDTPKPKKAAKPVVKRTLSTKPLNKPVSDEWGDDDNWGDDWSDDEAPKPKKIVKKPVVIKKVATPPPEASPVASQVAPPVQPPVQYASLPQQSIDRTTGFPVKTTGYPAQLASLLKSTASPNDLATTITALGLQAYPSLTELFLFYNDMHRLLEEVDAPVFAEFAKQEWLKIQIQWVEFLGTLVSLLNLEDDPSVQVTALDDYTLDGDNLEKILQIHHWIEGRLLLEMGATNPSEFKRVMVAMIEYINNRFLLAVLNSGEITEFQLAKIVAVIKQLNNLEVPLMVSIDVDSEQVPSTHRLKNLETLVNKSLREIVDQFYEGEFYDFSTEELTHMIEQVFIALELRSQSIQDILEVRTAT